MDTACPPPGLRDRKRAETQARIETAAIFLVLRDGLDETTVDAISERADISPRTFFNYFESKDAAILGLQPRELADYAMTAHLEAIPRDGDVVPTVVRLALTVMGTPAASTSEIHRDRLVIIGRHPEIVSSQFAQLSARKTRMVAWVAQLLATHPDFADDADAVVRAEVVLSLCASAAHAALHEWADDADPQAVDDIEQRAVALVGSTLLRLA